MRVNLRRLVLFVVPLALGLASRYGYVELADGFQWVESTPAVLAFGDAQHAGLR